MRTPYIFPDQTVPDVRPFELMTAWDAAFAAGFGYDGQNIAPQDSYGFTFQDADGQTKQLRISDPDACTWLHGINTVLALDTAKGAANALRFLALVECLGTCEWAGHLLQETEGGLNLHPSLTRAAARHPLTIGEPFNDETLHKMLVQDSDNGLNAVMGLQGI